MEPTAIIAVCAVVLAALTIISTQFGGRRTRITSYVEQLEARNAKLERENEQLANENFRLLRRLAANGG
jgi:outer membrane murein-binding lipoprotein Lpp